MNDGILLSGGMDSISLAWWKNPSTAYTVDYGQLAAEAEIAASSSICKRLNIPHHIITVDCKNLGSGDMAGTDQDPFAPASDWWPYRNQLIITLVAMKAIKHGIERLWIGTVQSDGSHLDGTPPFIGSISELLHMQEGKITVEAPAIEMSTPDLVRHSGIPLEHLAWAHSCHKSIVPCGTCRGCNKYFNVIKELGYELDRLEQP